MAALFLRVLAVSGVACILLAPLLLCGHWLERRYAPQTRWGLWVGTSLLLLLALLVTVYEPRIVVEVPAYAVTLPAAAPAQPQQGAVPAEGGQGAEAAVTPPTRQIPWTDLLAALWLAVAAALLLRQGAAYCLTRRRLLRSSTPAEGLEDCGLDLDVPVSFRRLPGLKSPMTLGILRPVVLLPEGEVPPLALRHELLHIKRGDIRNKAVIFLACSIHWFNPLVWLMARTADRDVEAACDAEVIRRSGEDCKKPYGELLLSAAAEAGGRVPFATRFGGEKEQMRSRLYQLFHPGRQNRPLACALLVAALLASATVACEQVPVDDTLYTNETYGFTLQLPESWAGHYRVSEGPDGAAFYCADYPEGLGMLVQLNVQTEAQTELTGRERLLGGQNGCWVYLYYPQSDALEGVGQGIKDRYTTMYFDMLELDDAAFAFVEGGDTLYLNQTYGFTLQLPESWAGKYTVTEDVERQEVYFFQKNHGNNSGLFFTLRAEDAATFRAEHEGKTDAEIEDGWPVQMLILGEGGGRVFYIDYVSDVNVDLNNEAIRAEYEEMDWDARSGITAEAFRYTGQT